MRNLIRIQKKCEWCGKEFTAYKCSTRFCCKQCNDHGRGAQRPVVRHRGHLGRGPRPGQGAG